LGRNKLLLPFRGGTVLSETVSRLLAAPLDRVVVVLGHAAEDVRLGAGLPPDDRLALVVNPGWEEGMAASLRHGLRACPDAEAVVVALGDQPDTDPAVVGRLLAAFRAGVPLAVPVHADPHAPGGERTGHPVLFARGLFGELEGLRGDMGARAVVRRHASQAARIPAPSLRDVDTEADYRALIADEGRG
jgi:CTP:molybdopterin cytidylyltransferase MocA